MLKKYAILFKNKYYLVTSTYLYKEISKGNLVHAREIFSATKRSKLVIFIALPQFELTRKYVRASSSSEIEIASKALTQADRYLIGSRS
jgi:hypothetical protein